MQPSEPTTRAFNLNTCSVMAGRLHSSSSRSLCHPPISAVTQKKMHAVTQATAMCRMCGISRHTAAHQRVYTGRMEAVVTGWELLKVGMLGKMLTSQVTRAGSIIRGAAAHV
mgnify:CR=1 FL=1